MPGQVTVACKLPHGLILQLCKEVEEPEQGQAGHKLVKVWKRQPERVKINGYLAKYQPDLPPAAENSSYALTHGVDKEFWDQWLAQNRELDMVKAKLIFASEKQDTVTQAMKTYDGTKCGLEPLDRNKLPKNISTYKKEAAS